MSEFKTLMDIFKLLEKTNCRKCDEKTCLAFAAAVFKGDRPLSDCPQIAPETARMHGGQPKKQIDNELEIEQQLADLREKLTKIDFAEAAKRVAAIYDGTRLVLKIMGKDFGVDAVGKIYTDIHVNPWVAIPILNYILYCKGAPMKKIADSCAELFSDLVDIFNGRPVDGHYQSDVALVLHPLPLVPLLICYWHPEEGMASELNLFFDASAEENLGIGGIYALGAGITRMFERLAVRHGSSSG
jgi:hypothetical protein